MLLKHGADVNAATRKDGHMALTSAEKREHADTVKVLLENGARTGTAFAGAS